MSKLEFIDALKRALAGLPPETVAKTLAYYEQRYIDGLAAGRSEREISDDLGEPKKIALTLRANSHLSAFELKRNPANLLRMLVSALGLGIFNLFMVVPAMVYAALLGAVYVAALTFYIGGIAITAGGLAGANELVLDGPLRHLFVNGNNGGDGAPMQTRIAIGESIIQIYQEPAAGNTVDQADGEAAAASTSQVIKRAEAFALGGLHVSTDQDRDSRSTQTMFGMAMLLFGIALFLISLTATRYTLLGIKRYIEMNFTLLKGR